MHRSFIIPLLLAVAGPACTTTTEEAAPETTAAANFEYACVPVCLERVACQTICAMEPFEPGFQVAPGPSTCDGLHQLTCGDGCCDRKEADVDGESYCEADCRIPEVEMAIICAGDICDINRRGLKIGSISPQGVAAEPTCR